MVWTVVYPVASVFTMSDNLSYLHGDMQSMLWYFALFLLVMFLVYTWSSLIQSIDKTAGGMVNSLARNIFLTVLFVVVMITVGSFTSLW